jgi:hypothetical protein
MTVNGDTCLVDLDGSTDDAELEAGAPDDLSDLLAAEPLQVQRYRGARLASGTIN